MNRGRLLGGFPKTIFYYGSQGCRIISDERRRRKRARSRLLICFAILLGLGVAASPGWGNPTQELTEKDNGKNVTIKVGERLVLNLSNSFGDGGYIVSGLLYNKSILKLVSRETLPPPHHLIGAWGRIIFTFEAEAAGETDLTVQISRAWEKDKPPLDHFKVKVKVIK